VPDGASRTGRAGVVSRLLALVLDLFVVVVVDLILVAGATLVRALFTQDVEVAVPPPPWGHVVTLFLLVVYMANGWAVGGRTLGMILLGLRAVREDGGDIKLPRAIARALLYLVFPPGILWAVVSSKNASIQDLIVDTAVVYDRGHARTS
jgi:uncharacterized RDD family membrane protein YckC